MNYILVISLSETVSTVSIISLLHIELMQETDYLLRYHMDCPLYLTV